MKIIYDTDKPIHERVKVEGYFEGDQLPVACFDIKIEFSRDGKPHSEMRFSRWGALSKQNGIHKLVASAIKNAMPLNIETKETA